MEIDKPSRSLGSQGIRFADKPYMTRNGSLLRVGFWIAVNLMAFAGVAPAAEDELVYHLIADRSHADLNDKNLAHPPEITSRATTRGMM